ncbi:MAG: isoprenyl transferase [Deltaproteobacteria bacterium]|nr:isoprenyl transferase [Deltaproteobacteria bacterium]
MAGSNSERTSSESDGLPRHVAIIMDGNGRWAERQNLSRIKGHRAGLDTVRETIRHCDERGIAYLTLYAFSEENWERPRPEVDALMTLLERFVDRELDELCEKNVRVVFIGRRERLRPGVLKRVEKAVDRTKDNTGLVVSFALSYGGRAEIVDAARRLMDEAKADRTDSSKLDEAVFRTYLYAPEIPDADLLIRTGGDYRISNFLLWQVAYAEIYTTDVMWPEFSRADFDAAIDEFGRRERRYGKTSAQLGQKSGGGKS